MSKVKYNIELLQIVISRDNATINENVYKDKHLNRDSFIKFNCSCGENDCEKKFREMFEKAGAFCKKCTTKNGKEKQKKTNLEKYGVEYHSQNKDIKDKIKATNLEKYGVECSLYNEKIKEKVKTTILNKYGVEYISQNSEIADKSSKNAYKRKEIVKSDGESIFLQGYEPQAYKILLETYTEDEIITCNKLKPEIWWKDNEDKKHRYFPDFYIPKDNLIIEIKSTRTFSLDDKKEKIEKTINAVKELGYKYEIWILNQKGEILEKC